MVVISIVNIVPNQEIGDMVTSRLWAHGHLEDARGPVCLCVLRMSLGYGLVDYVLHYARCPIAPSGAMDYIWHLVVSIMAPEMSSFGCLLLGSWLDPWI